MDSEARASGVLYAIYDLGKAPITFDVMNAFAFAHLHTERFGFAGYHMIFVLGEGDGYRNLTPKDKALDRAEKSWRLRQVLTVHTAIARRCVGSSVFESRVELDRLLKTLDPAQIFPPDYTVDRPTQMFMLAPYFDLTPTHAEMNVFVPTDAALRKVDAWLERHAPNRRPVVLTLRNAGVEIHRNARVEDWVQAAYTMRALGYDPIIVPDTDLATAGLDADLFPGLPRYTIGAVNLELRVALFRRAYLNMADNGGPAFLNFFMAGSTMLCFLPVDKLPGVVAQNGGIDQMAQLLGVATGDSFPNATPTCRFVWEPDRFENILYEFHKATRALDEATAPDTVTAVPGSPQPPAPMDDPAGPVALHRRYHAMLAEAESRRGERWFNWDGVADLPAHGHEKTKFVEISARVLEHFRNYNIPGIGLEAIDLVAHTTPPDLEPFQRIPRTGVDGSQSTKTFLEERVKDWIGLLGGLKSQDELDAFILAMPDDCDVGGFQGTVSVNRRLLIVSLFSIRMAARLVRVVRAARHLPKRPRTILELGGGFGRSLADMVRWFEVETAYLVDLPLNQVVSAHFLQAVFPGRVNLVWRENDTAMTGKINLVCPWLLHKIEGPIDLMTNFLSFHHMQDRTLTFYHENLVKDRVAHLYHENRLQPRDRVEGRLETHRIRTSLDLLEQGVVSAARVMQEANGGRPAAQSVPLMGEILRNPAVAPRA